MRRKGGLWSREGKIRRLLLKKERRKKGKPSIRFCVKISFQVLFVELHPCGQGRKLPLLKSPNFVVPSSAVQDPGIKGALFQEDCCHDLGLAGSIDSGFQIASAEDLTLPPARQLPVGFTHVAGSENTSNGHGNAGVSKVSRAWRGRQDHDGVGEFQQRDRLALRRLRDLEDGIEDHDGVGEFQQRDRLALRRLRDLEDGIEDVRAGAPAVAGESRGIIGLHEVSESDSSVHISRVSNSLNSSVGVVVSACARVASALPAAAAPRSWSTVARLSDAVVAHAHASPMLCARISGGTGGLLPVQRSTSYCLNNSWSDTVRVQGPTGTRRVKGGVSGPAEDLRPVSEVEVGVNFRPAGRVRGQVAGSLPRRQPGTETRRVRGGCGHTFPPPGGSWYPIRVTWTRIGHQAIDGLDEGVWNCTIGDLGAKG